MAAVAGDLGAAGGEQLGGREAVGAEEALHVGGRGVARLAGVDDGDAAAGAGQHQGGGQAGGASADDHDVVLVHVIESVAVGCSLRQRLLPFLGTRGPMGCVTATENRRIGRRVDFGRGRTRSPRPWTWSVRGCGGCASSAG